MKYTTSITMLAAFATGIHALPTSPNVANLVKVDLAKRDDGGVGVRVGMDLFSDDNCASQIAAVTVQANTCYHHEVGFSSMRVNQLYGGTDDDQGTFTAYTQGNCGCPTCGSHGYSKTDSGCLTGFGWVGNAIGYGYAPEILAIGELVGETVKGVSGLKPPKKA